MLRPAFLLLIFIPALSLAQQADKRVVRSLQADVAALASDARQGRTADYLISRYEKLKIPAYHGSYRHPFTFVHGLELNDSRIVLGGQSGLLGGDAFPLPFSANAAVSGDVLIEVQEQGAIWLLPLYEDAKQAADTGFDWQSAAWAMADQAAKGGATGVVFFDAYGAAATPRFDPMCRLRTLSIPVAFVGNRQWRDLSAHDANMVAVSLDVRLSMPSRTSGNIVAWLDNKAQKTLVIGANYDPLGTFETGGDGTAGLHGASDNASGTAAVLQLAEWLKKNKLRNYNYVFAHFSGGRIGQLGAKAFCDDTAINPQQIAGVLALRKLGCLPDSGWSLDVSGSPLFPMRSAISAQILKSGFKESGTTGSNSGSPAQDESSEITAFQRKQIPALLVAVRAYPGWQQESEVASQLNYAGEARIIAMLQAVLKKLDATAGKR